MVNKKEIIFMRELFTLSQNIPKQQKCLKDIKDLWDQYGLNEFKTELIRNIILTLEGEPKSPYTKHVFEFIIKILRSFSSISETTDETSGDPNRSDQENHPPVDDESTEIESNESHDELGLETLGSESFSRLNNTKNESTVDPNLTDMVIKEVLIKKLYAVDNDIRFNACYLIRKLFNDLEDIDSDVYNRLRKGLLDRCADKEKSIRCIAALALNRFQEIDDPKDLAISALKFHLKNDPDFNVRQSCLQSLHPTNNTIDEFIHATRDVKDIIRKTAFTLIAEKFQVNTFEIDKRLQILRNGLNERNESVKRTVTVKLLPNWVKTYKGSITDLLYALDIQSDPDLIEKMLNLYFNHILEQTEEGEVSGFHKLINEFIDENLDQYKLLTKVELTVERAFLWRLIAKFTKENNITITVTTDVVMGETDSQTESQNEESEPLREEKIDAIDKILPDLPHFCNYLHIFTQQFLANELDEHEVMEYEFMFNQLLMMGQLLEIGDEAQRQILRKYLTLILKNEELFNRINSYIPHVMKIFSLNCDTNMLLDITVNIIDSFHSSEMEADQQVVRSQEPVESSTAITTDQLRHYELEYAKISVRIQEYRDELEDAKEKEDYKSAQKIKDTIDELVKQKNEIMDKRLLVNSSQLTQSTQGSQTADLRTQKQLSDYPLALERCIQVFSGCLEFGNFKEVNSTLLAFIEKLVIPSILNEDILIRNPGIKCLGLLCLISADLAQKYFALFLQILNYDIDEAKEYALSCLFDFLCIHGLNRFENTVKSNKSINKSKQNSIEEEIDSIDETDEEEDNDKTVIDSEFAVNLPEEEEEISFMQLFTDLIVKHLDSDSDNLRLIVAKGIAKLFLLGRMFSPELLSKLIILWYGTDSTLEMRQFLGVFLPIYSGMDFKSNLKGQQAFEECFTLTVETVFTQALNDINIDNMINFMVELISDEGHKRLAISITNRILTLTIENDLSTKYFLRSLTLLRYNEMTSQEVKDFQLLFKRIEKLYSKVKGLPKVTKNRIQSIKTKISKQIDFIKHNSSQVTLIEDFGSQTMSQSLSQTLFDRSSINESPHNSQ